MHGSSCVLTDKEQFYVRVCGCGVVHLGFGASSVNVSPDLIPFIAETLAIVARDLEMRRRTGGIRKEEASIDDAGNIVFGNFQKN